MTISLSERLRAKARKVVVPYSEATAAAHSAFAARMWSKRRRREPSYQRWKFRGPPQGPVPGLLLAIVKGEAVGQAGFIPVRARANGRDCDAQWACDLMVDERMRTAGYGALLLLAAMDRGMLTLGSDPSPLAEPTMVSLGFRCLNGPVKMLLPLRLDHVLSWRLKGPLARCIPLVATILRPLVAIRNRKLWWGRDPNDYRHCPWSELRQDILDHDAALAEPHIVHNADFLKWRCAGLDGFSDPMTGIRSRLGGWALVSRANPYCYVVDWHASGDPDLLCLVRGIAKFARASRCSTVKILANSDLERKWLATLGFLPMRHRTLIYIHPDVSLSGNGSFFRYSLYDSDENI